MLHFKMMRIWRT
ncbi:hypothetical protein LINPERPRIM_LOCUS32584 [Linum perenne]